MYANLKPFSLMGLPNKLVAVAPLEKDLHVSNKRDAHDNCLQDTRETLELISTPPLKIIVPSRGVDVDDGGCTTPKAEDRGDVVLLKCPPPPRKPKSTPLTKRKAKRVLLDLSHEIESMFPSNIVRDFMCGKIKKIRTGCSEIL